MTESAFARAAAQASGTPAADQLTGQVDDGYDPLFGGGQSMPSIFNRTHGVGDKVTGIISDIPKDKQSRFLDEDENGKPTSGKLKYWGEDNRPTDQPVAPNGTQRKPVMDTVIPLNTDYNDRGAEDTGLRAWYVAGKPALDAMRKAIQAAGITSRQQMVGYRLTVWRTGKIARAWQYEATLTK